jgi:hypothetical protein
VGLLLHRPHPMLSLEIGLFVPAVMVFGCVQSPSSCSCSSCNSAISRSTNPFIALLHLGGILIEVPPLAAILKVSPPTNSIADAFWLPCGGALQPSSGRVSIGLLAADIRQLRSKMVLYYHPLSQSLPIILIL